MSRITERSVQSVIDQTSIVDIVGEYVRLEKKGNRYWGCCPFHTEKTASFSLDTQKNFFYCFGCQKGGSAATFLMEYDRLSFPDAIEKLAKKAGITLEYENDGRGDEGRKSSDRDALHELYKRVAQSMHFFLLSRPEGKRALEYLVSRSLNPETIEKFILGYAPADRTWLWSFLKGKGYTEDFLEKTGLFSSKNKRSAFFSDRILFPIADQSGEIVAFGGRLLSGDGPKYLNSPETEVFQKSRMLFALNLAIPGIKQSNEAIICEGYMDVIALHQAGIMNAVAPLGTAFTEQQARLLKRYANTILLLFDSDSAGQNAVKKAIVLCERVGLDCQILVLKDGKDPAEILEKYGQETLQKALLYRINEFTYLVDCVLSLHDIKTPEGKTQAIRWMFPFLEAIESAVRRDSVVELLSKRIGVEKNSILEDLAKNNGGFRGNERRISAENKRTEDSKKSQSGLDLQFMLALAIHSEFFSEVRLDIGADDLESEEARLLFISMEECFRGDSLSFNSLLSSIQDESLRKALLEKSSTDEYSLNARRYITDGLKRIKKRVLDRKRRDIILKLQESENSNSRESINDLLSEKMYIDKELDRLKDEY